ncbi:response regulator [Treponema sp.]
MYSLLIADDESLEREALRLFIEESNLDIEKILECTNGTDAIRICLLERPDIVLLDINTPGSNGLEVLENIRIGDKKSKVIISTAYDYFEYAQKALSQGVSDFLVKPVKQSVLIGALNKAIDELDAELFTENRLSKVSEMLESMGGRLASDLICGTVSEEALYYLEALGVRPESGGTTFHMYGSDESRKENFTEIVNNIKQALSFLDLAPIFFVDKLRVALILFSKNGPLEMASFDKVYSMLENILASTNGNYKLGMGIPFISVETISASYMHALKSSGDSSSMSASLGFANTPEKDVPQEINKILDFIESNFDKKIGLDDIAEAVGGSKFHICRQFKFHTDSTIVDYLVQRRIKRAKELLKDGDFSIKQISSLVGYSDPNYFTLSFKKAEGISPLKYRYSQGLY